MAVTDDDDAMGAGPEASTSIIDALTAPDILAGIMAQMGLKRAHLASAVSTVWRHAAFALQEERRVLRPSHSIGWGNEALGQFRSPSGVIALPSGELCVADTNNHRLQVLTRAGEVRCVVGAGPGGNLSEFQQPTGLACDGTALYVADSGNCRIHKLSLPRGEPLMTIGSFGDMPGLLHAPVGLALHEGKLYCADSRNHRIAVFETQPALRFLHNFCTHGSAAGELGTTSSGIYLAAYASQLFVADRSNHRLQVFGLDGGYMRTIGKRGTAPGDFRRLRGVAACNGKLFTAECERVQVLTLAGHPLQVLPLPGSSALVGICADASHVCVVDQTHQKVRVLSVIRSEERASPSQPGDPHLPPFLLPTRTCDSTHASVLTLARRLVPTSCSAARGAASVRAWVRATVVLGVPADAPAALASQTLSTRRGTAADRANLQVALLRASGIAAGFVLVDVTRDALAGPHMPQEVLELYPPTITHAFCAAYVPYVPPPPPPEGTAHSYGGAAATELGRFRHYDASALGGSGSITLAEYLPFSDETQPRARFRNGLGPMSPVQANLDHAPLPGVAVPPELYALLKAKDLGLA